ncbi:antirestriction protein ArdA [Parasulfitobacter algicola]|uniref:Antirestriction protein ArdA n=1 Tax=Parasulfitobacter algicola TaxID=2614809 RepID=A0ABX2IVE4_9RHOB|nr:antirestriction protein ArdA [Sulfitobacter algicola]NSX56896.1 antirestriction protein ArdA [Sulfitobacter algicola]
MPCTFYAQPYDITATGFYFETAEDFTIKAAVLRNEAGQPVEEFELQFIDGDAIDAALADALGLYQNTIALVIAALEGWDTDQKTRAILAIGECSCAFDLGTDRPDDLDVDVYYLDSLRDLAIEFVAEGIMGEIPDALERYFDYDALARDLGVDYSETIVAGQRLIYRCA